MMEPTPNPALAYETHLVPAMFRPWSGELISRAGPGPGDRILDLACGTGIVVRQVAPLVAPSGTITGLDISEPMLEVAKSSTASNGVSIDWQQGNAEALPFPGMSFDLVLCQQGLQFVPDRSAAAREMARVLRPSGKAVVSVWRGLDYHPVFAAVDEAIDRQFGQTATTPFSLGDASTLESYFEGVGFHDVKLEPVTRDVSFPSAQGFVGLIVMSAAAVIPELGQMNDEGSDSLIDRINTDVAPALEPYRSGDGLTFPMHAHIVTAHAAPDGDQ